MLHTIAIQIFPGCSSRIFQQIFNRVGKTFIGVQESVLNFLFYILSVNSLVLLLSTVGTEVVFDFMTAVSASIDRIHYKMNVSGLKFQVFLHVNQHPASNFG